MLFDSIQSPVKFYALVFTFLLYFKSGSIFAQDNLTKEWDKTLGGSGRDKLTAVVALADGGCLVGGTSNSWASTDKSENSKNGSDDYWVVKLNANGTKAWDKTFGGTEADYLNKLLLTPDNGFLLGGYTNSPASPDKASEKRGYWIIKLDSDGNKLWDKTFSGGGGSNVLTSLITTPDGGYLLGGYSTSMAELDKTENSRGDYDYWIIKINANGDKIWDKTYGGTNGDYLYAMTTTPDGGYLIGGNSSSSVSNDKTDPSNGRSDFWILKLNADGTKVWDKTYGGTNSDILASIVAAPDYGFILGGSANSQPLTNTFDFWIIKIDDSGNKHWDKIFGGDSSDHLNAVLVTPQGYLLGGTSNSDKSGNKSEISYGGSDYWLVNIDLNGNKIWDKTFGGDNSDDLTALTSTRFGSYILGGYSFSGAEFDKSEPSRMDSDYWVVKLNAVSNESPTAINLSNAVIPENNSLNALIGTLTSNDPNVEDKFTYKLINGEGDADNNAFKIQGTALLANQVFDFETKNIFSIRIQTKDAWGLTFETPLVITVTKVQETVTGIPDEQTAGLKVYPTKADQTLNIQSENLISLVQVMNNAGSLVLSEQVNKRKAQLNMRFLAPGVYFVLISSAGKTQVRRIVVSH